MNTNCLFFSKRKKSFQQNKKNPAGFTVPEKNN